MQFKLYAVGPASAMVSCPDFDAIDAREAPDADD
jgi:hypothetical protein